MVIMSNYWVVCLCDIYHALEQLYLLIILHYFVLLEVLCESLFLNKIGHWLTCFRFDANSNASPETKCGIFIYSIVRQGQAVI